MTKIHRPKDTLEERRKKPWLGERIPPDKLNSKIAPIKLSWEDADHYQIKLFIEVDAGLIIIHRCNDSKQLTFDEVADLLFPLEAHDDD